MAIVHKLISEDFDGMGGLQLACEKFNIGKRMYKRMYSTNWKGVTCKKCLKMRKNANAIKKKEKPLEVTLKWKLLERIAEYYEFPTAVFLSDINNFDSLPKTRNETFRQKAEKFDKIKDIFEDDGKW